MSPTSKKRVIEIIRFGIVGTTAMLIHYGIYYFLLPVMDKNIAYSIGYFLSFLCNYLMSSYFTFNVKPSFRRFFRFLCSHGVNYFIYLGLFNFFYRVGVPDKYAPLPVYLIAVPISFILVRYALIARNTPDNVDEGLPEKQAE